MKNNLLFFIVLGFFINNSIELVASALDDSAIEEISELNKFFEKYKLPEDIIDIFNAHSDAILFSKYYEKFKQLPQFYIKDEKIGRLVNAERMRQVIEENHLVSLVVPKKYIYQLHNKIKVLADTVESVDFDKLSLKETQDIVKFIEMTGYCDLHKGNFVRSATTNQLVIIDTEDNAFVRNKEEISCFYGEDPKNIFDFFRQEIIVLMDIKAFKWFRQYCQECSVEEVFYNFKPIPINQDYDHLIGVDFEQVKTALPAHMRMKSKL